MRSIAPITNLEQDMFRRELRNMLDQRHPLYRLADIIDWDFFDAEFGRLYCPNNGAPAKPTRLMVGLHYLKHIDKLSDEAVVSRWIENPYWQYFCGEKYFQHDLPIDPSSMTRFRKRIGEDGCEKLLQATIEAGLKTGAVKPGDFKRVTVDTTVQEKAVTYPTDAKLLNRSRVRLARLCERRGLTLRQSYARTGPKLLLQANRYAHAKQYRRLRRQIKRLRTILGRVVRDIERKTANSPLLGVLFQEEIKMARRLLTQGRTGKDKLYSLHAPEVECISKGKEHKRYEFGVKASIAVTNKSNFVVGAMALPGRPYDGHSLVGALEQVRKLTQSAIEEVFVDRGYRGHGEKDAAVYISGQRRGITKRLKRLLKRRQAGEPVIGHLKTDGHLGRNYLLGADGDQINVVLSSAGHNLRLAMKKLAEIFCAYCQTAVFGLVAVLKSWVRRVQEQNRPVWGRV